MPQNPLLMRHARFPKFYQHSVAKRLQLLHEQGFLSSADVKLLGYGQQVLKNSQADKMIENVIGVFGLPLAVALNFNINQQAYVVPLVVEEPSIVAALSSAAKLLGISGGFTATSVNPLLIGQIQVVNISHPTQAKNALFNAREAILDLANSLHPNMVARGGGARDIEVHLHPLRDQHGDMLVVHLLVDTCDAMGANVVNTMCESVASLIEQITGGKVFLRILSNLTDRAMVHARAQVAPADLTTASHPGTQVRDGIVLANDFAVVDPYRAATHNKGIMNGIDAVAIATGNDWRALEAAAHAYAGRGSSYTALTKWYVNDIGNLVGELHIPLKVGIVGGNLQSNPAVAVAHRLLGLTSARQLACVMAAVGLAQNFAALRALATDGIQRGHMTLHARSVASAAGVPSANFEQVVDKLVKSGEIKIWKAQQIMQQITAPTSLSAQAVEQAAADCEAVGHGKVVLLGEHAVVYDSHALAAYIPNAIRAKVTPTTQPGVQLVIPAWDFVGFLQKSDTTHSLHRSLELILQKLQLTNLNMVIHVYPSIPRAMGLGGSAALAVAVIRALSLAYDLNLTDAAVNALAFESEKVAHGMPSGVDNTLATYGHCLLFKRGEPPMFKPVKIREPIELVLGLSGVESLTAKMVARVHAAWQNNKKLYGGIFADIDSLTLQATEALQNHDLPQLGELMNINQGLLNGLQVSSYELEDLIHIARRHGALGAKLTGSGGGGSMIALCPGSSTAVRDAMRQAGYHAMMMHLGQVEQHTHHASF